MASHIPVKQTGKSRVQAEVPPGGRPNQHEKQENQQQAKKKLEFSKRTVFTQKTAQKTSAQQLAEFREQVERLQNDLHQKEMQLTKSKLEVEEKENDMSEKLEILERTIAQADNKLESYEHRLLQCNVDPVSLDNKKYTAEEQEHFRLKRLRAKENVLKLKSAMAELRSESEDIMAELQEIRSDLETIVQDPSAII